MESLEELKQRAHKSFSPIFRDLLCNAVQKYILAGGIIKPSNGKINIYCKCPEGCLEVDDFRYPSPIDVSVRYGFSVYSHRSFQAAFDDGIDNDTPEAALGLLYRKRFYGLD